MNIDPIAVIESALAVKLDRRYRALASALTEQVECYEAEDIAHVIAVLVSAKSVHTEGG